MRNPLVLLYFVVLTACSTRGSIVLNEISAPISQVQRLVVNELPLGKRSQSVNGREFSSAYFTVMPGGEYESAETASVRQYVHIEILGDRRPYKVTITVPVETRDANGQYRLVKKDLRLARVISRRIQKALNERREDRNIIDDFRVF